MDSLDVIVNEATGVFPGTLIEDMIDTVTRTHQLYCNVDIPKFYEKTFPHPLTYVPLWALTLPLKKGDKVYVKFHNNDLEIPVLWRTDDDIDKGMYENYEFPSAVEGGNIGKLSAVKTFYAQKFGDDSFLIKTAQWTMIRQNNSYVLLDRDEKVYIQGKELNAVSTGKTNLDSDDDITLFTNNKFSLTSKKDMNLKTTGKMEFESDGDITLKTNGKWNFSIKDSVSIKSATGKVELGNQIATLGQMISDMIDYISNINTVGSPANHKLSPDSIANFTILKQKWNQVFN